MAATPAPIIAPLIPLIKQVMMMAVTQAIATMVLLGMLFLLSILIIGAIYASFNYDIEFVAEASSCPADTGRFAKGDSWL